MKINIAKSAGFCFGVKRALEIALKTAKSGRKIEMLGDIVHNEDVVKQINKLGIKKVNYLKKGLNKTILIRAHGADKKLFKEAATLGYSIIYATCPMVKEIHRIATQMENKNFKIITNMARVENGLKNKMAGIDLIKALRDEYMYMEPIFVITNEEERNDVEFIMKECKLSDRIYMIGSKIEDLNYFFRDFKDFNEFRDFNIQQEHMLNSTINAGKCCVSSVSCNWSKCIIY